MIKNELLEMLAGQEGYVSGEQLSHRLGISRTAVWKQIQSLRQQGYEIEAEPRRGYRLKGRPDRLLPQEIARQLTASRLGKRIVYFEETDSTNEVAKRLAREGAEEGTLVVAEAQTKGKGRLGRQWLSPAGEGLYFTLILRPPFPPQRAPQMTLIAAVAVARALSEATGLEVKIKWPNDILVNGRKVAGILTEMVADMDRIHYLVVGIGININQEKEAFPSEVAEIATSLRAELGYSLSRLPVLVKCLSELERVYEVWLKEGFGPLLAEWKRFSHTLGQWVRVNVGEEIVEGKALEIEEDGSLLIQQKDGSFYRVIAGDVLFS